VVSPILSNLFLHYTFDIWMQRNHPTIPFGLAPVSWRGEDLGLGYLI